MASATVNLLVIVGPTASGKTRLAIEIAKQYNGEIICADSRTIYKDMNLGTAKPTQSEQEQVEHHAVDVISPGQRFSAAEFKSVATRAINDIRFRGKLPILVGGSGLYVDAVIFDYQFAPRGAKRDSVNPRHIDTSESRGKSKLPVGTIIVGLDPGQTEIKENITNRIESIVEDGFLEEVRVLADKYGWDAPGLLAPGYKAFRPLIENKISLDEAKAEAVRNENLLARRQRTWFKRNKSIQWFKNGDDAVEFLTTKLNKNSSNR